MLYTIMLLPTICWALMVTMGTGGEAVVNFHQFNACPATLKTEGIAVSLHSSMTCAVNDNSCYAVQCTLKCRKDPKCAAALVQSGKCVRATAQAFLSNWLPGSKCRTYVDTDGVRRFQQGFLGNMSTNLWRSLKLLYNFRAGLFNLAPIVGGHPYAPVARGVTHNKSLGIYFAGHSASVVDVVTSPDTDQIFLPATNVTVYIRGLFHPNFDSSGNFMHFFHFTNCNDTARMGERFSIKVNGNLFRIQLSTDSTEFKRFSSQLNAFLNSSDFVSMGYFSDNNQSTTFFYNGQYRTDLQYNMLNQNEPTPNSPEYYSCLRIGGFKFDIFSLLGWMHCFVLAVRQLTIAEIEEIDNWCRNN